MQHLGVAEDGTVKIWTTKGFKVMGMTISQDTVKCTKVIVFIYPLMLDPDFLLGYDTFVKTRGHEVRGGTKNCVVALMNGRSYGEDIYLWSRIQELL